MRDLFARSLTGSSTEPVVTLTRRYAASPAQLWSAITEPDRLARWLGEVEIDTPPQADAAATTVARIRFADDPDHAAMARILSCDPQRSLTAAWDWGSEASSTVIITLTPDGDDTLLSLEQRLGEPDHVVDYGGGWEEHLRALVDLLGDATAFHAGAGAASAPTSPWNLLHARPLELELEVAATPSVVWDALTTPEGLRGWWWNHWADVEISADATPGGTYRFTAPAAGISVAGRYLRVERASHLAFTWTWIDSDGASRDEACDIALWPTESGCRLRLRHTGPWSDDAPAASYRQGWEFVFAALRESVETDA